MLSNNARSIYVEMINATKCIFDSFTKCISVHDPSSENMSSDIQNNVDDLTEIVVDNQTNTIIVLFSCEGIETDKLQIMLDELHEFISNFNVNNNQRLSEARVNQRLPDARIDATKINLKVFANNENPMRFIADVVITTDSKYIFDKYIDQYAKDIFLEELKPKKIYIISKDHLDVSSIRTQIGEIGILYDNEKISYCSDVCDFFYLITC